MERVILLSMLVCLLCLIYCTNGDGEQKSPYSHSFLMDPLSHVDNELAENADEDDESEFDFVGHKDNPDTVPNNDVAESAVTKDLIKEQNSSPEIDEHGESNEKNRKNKIERSNEDYDDFTGMTSPLDHIHDDLLAVRDTITRHTIDKHPTDVNDDNDNNREENLQVTKNLIGLLYDFKGNHRKHNGRLMDDDDDDLMDLEDEGSKKTDLPSASKSKNSKEKIDVTVNVNINSVPKTDKKKSKVETSKDAKSASPSAKVVNVTTDKRSHVSEVNKQNKASPTVTSNRKSAVKITDDDDEDDDSDDEDDDEAISDNPSDRRQHNNAVSATNTRVSSTLSHLKDIKAPPALMNQLKKKIQQEEDEEEKDEDEDDVDDNDDDASGSGSGMSDMTRKSQQDPININNKSSEPEVPAEVDVKSKTNTDEEMTSGEDTEKLGNNVHLNLHNNTLSAATNEHVGTEMSSTEQVKSKEEEEENASLKSSESKSTKDMTLEEIGDKFKKWQEKKKIDGEDERDQSEGETKSWMEEKEKLLEKLKNPLIVAKKNGLLMDDQEGDDEKSGRTGKVAADITKSADDAFAKIVDTVTSPDSTKELANTQAKDVKDVSASAEKAFATVVNNVMSGKANELSLNHHALSKTANDLISNVKDVSQGTNVKKLMKFKLQIMSEIEKIHKLQKEYGSNMKGSSDLSEARSVLEKDLKVVNELEHRLKNQHTTNKQAQVVHHDQKVFGQFALGQSETIPDDKLGFGPEAMKQQKSSKSKKAKNKTKRKKKGKGSALKEIQSLLKDEIRRLKRKKSGKPDLQLNDIRKLVQKKLKGFLKSGNLDKTAFKKLAPEIKELGNLLKHRIKNAKKYHDKVLKATKGNYVASHGSAPSPVDHKGISEELNIAQEALVNTDPHTSNLKQQSETLQAAKNALSRIQSSNISLIGSQSSRMKSLLTTLNSKIGKVFSGVNTAGASQNQQSQPISLQKIQGMNPLGQQISVPTSFSPGLNGHPGEPLLLPKTPYQANALAKAETPEPDFEPDQSKPIADSEPVNTLIEALERDITEVWSYKDQFPNADSLGLDNDKVHNAYANLGSLSGLSLRRSLDRALRGEDVGLAIVGGSISKGGPFSEKGLDYVLKSYFYSIEDYWNKIIRPVTGSSLIVRDCSIGGISTDYYSFCLRNHLPDDKLTNIVLWELSANDMKRYEEAGKSRTQPLEQFVRNVVSYRAKPSLIFVNFFANFDWDPDLAAHCRNFEDEGGDDIAKYYKITSLSWRNMVCPEMQSGSPLFTREKLFSEDKFHPSIQGHAQVAYLLIDYLRTEFLKNLVKMRTTNIADAVTRLQIPHSVYVPRPLFRETFTWKPLCYTYMMTDEHTPNNTLSLDTTPSGSFRSTVVRAFKIRSDKIAGMNTLDKDQHVRYTIHLPPHPGGSIEPYKKLGIMSFTDDRSAHVQFDAEPTQFIETGKKFLEGTTIRYVAKDVRPGDHQLSIRSGDNGFLVCAVLVG